MDKTFRFFGHYALPIRLVNTGTLACPLFQVNLQRVSTFVVSGKYLMSYSRQIRHGSHFIAPKNWGWSCLLKVTYILWKWVSKGAFVCLSVVCWRRPTIDHSSLTDALDTNFKEKWLQMIKRCLDQDLENRPSISTLTQILGNLTTKENNQPATSWESSEPVSVVKVRITIEDIKNLMEPALASSLRWTTSTKLCLTPAVSMPKRNWKSKSFTPRAD